MLQILNRGLRRHAVLNPFHAEDWCCRFEIGPSPPDDEGWWHLGIWRVVMIAMGNTSGSVTPVDGPARQQTVHVLADCDVGTAAHVRQHKRLPPVQRHSEAKRQCLEATKVSPLSAGAPQSLTENRTPGSANPRRWIDVGFRPSRPEKEIYRAVIMIPICVKSTHEFKHKLFTLKGHKLS